MPGAMTKKGRRSTGLRPYFDRIKERKGSRSKAVQYHPADNLTHDPKEERLCLLL